MIDKNWQSLGKLVCFLITQIQANLQILVLILIETTSFYWADESPQYYYKPERWPKPIYQAFQRGFY